MGIFDKFRKEKRSYPPETIYVAGGGYIGTLASTKNTTVISCKNMLIDSISNLPINLYFRKNDDERVTPYNHPLYSLFKYQPNSEEPISLFISRIMDSLIENGNAFLFKNYNGETINNLYVLDATKTKVSRNGLNQKIFIIDGKQYTDKEILHIPGKYYDGLTGKSLTDLAKDAINLGNRLNDYTGYHFENMISGGRLSIDLKDYADKHKIENVEEINEHINQIQSMLNRNYTGEQNAGKSLILPPGVKAEQLESGSNQNAQLAELRELQERQICSVFDIPYDIFSSENKYNSLEQRNELFKNRTLQFWTSRISDFLDMLLTPYERQRYYFEFDYNSFLKTDKKSRTENQIKQLNNGILTLNEIRKMENLTSIDPEIGDVRFIGNTSIPLTEENIKAYFAKSKLALEEMQDTKIDDHLKQGDDKV